MKTTVRVLRGRLAGRHGWIAGDLADRATRGITRAIVHVAGEPAELLATASLRLEDQPGFCLPETQKDTPPARGRRRSDDQLILIT